MRRIIFTVLAIFALNAIQAQEKGLHLFVDGNVGATKFKYALNGGKAEKGIGYGGGLGMQYFFTNHVGLSLGVEFNQFNTSSYYNLKEFRFEDQLDNEGDSYQMKVALINWQENQRTLFLDIPLMLALQKKFGRAEQHGIYFGAGVKAQLPLQSQYGRNEGSVSVSAYYKQWELSLGEDVELPKHNLGVNDSREWLGINKIKPGLALTGEFGFLLGLSRRVDIKVGITADYGLINVKKSNEVFVEPTDVQQIGQFIADKINYAGILNGNNTDNKIIPLAIRGSLGLRVKLGRLKELNDIDPFDEEWPRYSHHDTIIVHVTVPRDSIVINNYIGDGYVSKNNTLIPTWYVPTEEERKNMNDSLVRSQILQKIQTIEETMEEPIFFDLGKHSLRDMSIIILDNKVVLMRKYPALMLSVVGHTCDIGGEELNVNLSFLREKIAREYMMSKGINAKRLNGLFMGKKYPVYPNDSEANRSLNRRVDFMITD